MCFKNPEAQAIFLKRSCIRVIREVFIWVEKNKMCRKATARWHFDKKWRLQEGRPLCFNLSMCPFCSFLAQYHKPTPPDPHFFAAWALNVTIKVNFSWTPSTLMMMMMMILVTLMWTHITPDTDALVVLTDKPTKYTILWEMICKTEISAIPPQP